MAQPVALGQRKARSALHKQQNRHTEMFCSLVRILLVSIAEQHDCVHEPGATLWLKA
jgi:hypothetical protein